MDFSLLVSQISHTNDHFQKRTVRTIDKLLTLRNWLIGGYIYQFEQNGADKAAYGSKLELTLAKRINQKGLSARNLKLFKQFYLAYPQIVQTLSALSDFPSETMQTMSASFPIENLENDKSTIDYNQITEHISFSHFVELMKLDDKTKREFYETQIIQSTLSVRELKRQIDSLTFERVAAANDKPVVLNELRESSENKPSTEILKTPYVFDFLGLPDTVLASESDLENALLSDLKNFMLELGHGFCFEEQQKRIVIGGEYYFLDMVFYHRILKCHVLIELKIDSFKHQYAGQLNTYLQYYKKNIKEETDNPPIGILLCTNQNKALVEYALGGMDENLFVSQYKTELPTPEELTAFLQTEKDKHL